MKKTISAICLAATLSACAQASVEPGIPQTEVRRTQAESSEIATVVAIAVAALLIGAVLTGIDVENALVDAAGG